LSLRSLRPWEMVTLAMQVRGSADRFRAFLQSHPCDIVHLNSVVQVPAALGAHAAGLPVVWHVREELHPGYLGLRRAWVRRCVDRCASRVVAISRRNASQLLANPKITVVYNFVDFRRFDRNLKGDGFRKELGLSATGPVIGMLGGVIESKGADVFTEAAFWVRKRHPGVVFLIAGHPPAGESPSLMKRVARRVAEGSGMISSVQRRVLASMCRLGLQSTVRFVGLRHDVPEMLAACDVLAWPATVSHFSRPVIEAGAMARPVVAADFPSSRELVAEGETGLLFRPGDARGMADAILRLLGDPDETRRMGEAGFVLARQRYDSRRNAAAIAAIYDDLLPDARPETVSA